MVPMCLRCDKLFPTNVTLKLCLAGMFGLDMLGQGGECRAPISAVVATGQSGLVATALKGAEDPAVSLPQVVDKTCHAAELFVTKRTVYGSPRANFFAGFLCRMF